MDMTGKTKEQKEAWLDGYKAATESAESFKVLVGHREVDESLNTGAQMVAALLRKQVKAFDKENEHGGSKT
jgi:hypothetical protein